MKTISSLELKQKIDANVSLYLLDIREPYERALSCIPSIHIPMAEVSDHAASFPKDQEIIIICRSGRRAEAVANLLTQDFQMPNVTILAGGLLGWKLDVDSSLDID